MNYDESGTPLVKSRCQLQVVILSLGSGLFVVVFHFLSLVAALFPFLSFLLPLTFLFCTSTGFSFSLRRYAIKIVMFLSFVSFSICLSFLSFVQGNT